MIELHNSERQPVPGPAIDEVLFQLGIECAAGEAAEPDLVAAHKWFNLAATKGNPRGTRYRQEIAFMLSGGEIAQAQRQAREWLRTH